MARSPFDPAFSELPRTLPIFPLSGVLLLPGGRLPLNVFEPRYLAMTRAALAGQRLIGMVQPRDAEAPGLQPEVQKVGCAGRIVFFADQPVRIDWKAIEETADDRLIVSLAMLCPFEAAEKQILLEASSPSDRARVMIALLESAALSRGEGDGPQVRH